MLTTGLAMGRRIRSFFMKNKFSTLCFSGAAYANINVLNEVTDWSEEARSGLQNVYEETPLVAMCFDYAEEESKVMSIQWYTK